MKHSNRIIFVLMVHFSHTFEIYYVYHLEKNPGILVLMYIVAIAKIADSQQIISFNKLFVCIILSIRPISLLQIISNRYLACQM